MVASLLAFVALAPGVSFESRAEPLGDVLGRLSVSMGVDLYAERSLAHEPLLAIVRDAPREAVLDRLAATFAAHWEKDDRGGLKLARIPGEERKLEKRHLADARRRLESAIEVVEGGEDLSQAWSPEDAERALRSRAQNAKAANAARIFVPESVANLDLPVGRALRRALALLPIDELATLPPERKVCWSNVRGRYLNPLPADKVGDLLGAFRTEQNGVATSLAQHPELAPSQWSLIGPFGGLQKPDAVVDAEPATLLVKAARRAGEAAPLLEIGIGDRDGNTLASGNLELAPRPEARTYPLSRIAADAPVPLREETKTFFDGFDARAKKPLTPEFLDLLLHPERHDPLGYDLFDALKACAEHGHVDVMAVPCDWQFARFPAADAIPLYAALERLVRPDGANVIKTDGWLCLASCDPVESEADRVDRSCFARALQAIRSAGYVTNESRLTLSDAGATESYQAFPMIYVAGLRPKPQQETGPGDIAALRLARAFDQVGGVQTFPVHELGVPEIALLNHLLFETDGPRLTITGPDPRLGGERHNLLMTLRAEPCFGLPDGLPMESTLRIDHERMPSGFTVDDSGFYPRLPERIAFDLTSRSRSASYVEGRVDLLEGVLTVDPSAEFRFASLAAFVDLTKPAQPFDVLSDALKSAVAAARSRFGK